MAPVRDSFSFWKPPIAGVEILHAGFRRHEYPRHTHEAATIALVDEGAVRFTYRGRVHVARAGDVFFIDPGEVHTGGAAHPDGYSYRVIYLSQRTLNRLLFSGSQDADGKSAEFRHAVVRDEQLAFLLDRAHNALAAGAGVQHGYGAAQEQALAMVGDLLGLKYAEPGRTSAKPAARVATGTAMSTSTSVSVRRRVVGAARDYLESHLADRILLADLATAAETSVFWLSRAFADEVGMPPHAYHNARRVDRARSLLADGRPPTQVASEVGFYDQAHFTRVFKHYTGTTPRRFAHVSAR